MNEIRSFLGVNVMLRSILNEVRSFFGVNVLSLSHLCFRVINLNCACQIILA